MKLPRTTLVLVILALALGVFVYFKEIRSGSQEEQINSSKQKIFAFTEDDIKSLTIKANNQTIVLERNSNSDDTNKWLLKSPLQAPASNPYVSYLTNLLVKGQTEKTFSTPEKQLADFGLNNPKGVIEIKLKNQQTHQLTLGKHDFKNAFLYARGDTVTKPDGNVDILLVSKDFENAVNRPLSEWQEALDKPTSTPSTPSPNLSQPTPLPTTPIPVTTSPQAIPTPTTTPKSTTTPKAKP
jgi:Domain of unknown function (DUF4340)